MAISLLDIIYGTDDTQFESLDSDESWKKEWQEMPEFVQLDSEPYATMIVRFASEQDLQDFSNLIGQRLNSETKSFWHPKLVRRDFTNLGYEDES